MDSIYSAKQFAKKYKSTGMTEALLDALEYSAGWHLSVAQIDGTTLEVSGNADGDKIFVTALDKDGRNATGTTQQIVD